MTKEETYKKLDLLKSDEGKINYLETVLKRKNLLSPKTQEAVYSTLLDLYIKKGGRWSDAKRVAEKLGNKKVLPKILEGYIEEGEWYDAEILAEKMMKEGMKVPDELLADIYEHTGKAVEAMRLRKKIAREKGIKVKDFEELIKKIREIQDERD